jgi:hypothetical protein
MVMNRNFAPETNRLPLVNKNTGIQPVTDQPCLLNILLNEQCKANVQNIMKGFI